MANEEQKGEVGKEEEKGGCCGGMHKGKCCGGKLLAVIGLLALGGIGGFFAGKHCQHSCDMKASVSAPATPAPATTTPQK